MKKFLVFVPALIIIILAGVAFYQSTRPDLIQERSEDFGMVMLPSTIPVEREVQQAVLVHLAPGAADRQTNTYAITNSYTEDGKIYVSVAGLPPSSTKMRMADTVWLGLVTLEDKKGYPGIVTEDPMMEIDSAPQFDYGGPGNILPFRSGTTATYGMLGVHSCGFSMSGWKAVDLFPVENMVYSTADGDVSYVCRDSHQVALRIGYNLYTHILDSGQQTGRHYQQGDTLGGMPLGTFDDTCGYADQAEDHYHVHFCFVPNQAGTWSADGYALNVTNNNWVKGGETVEPNGTLTASWVGGDPGDIPGPANGANLWDSLVGGVIEMVNTSLSSAPNHEAIGLSGLVMSKATPVLTLIYVVVFSFFNMTVPMIVVGIIALLETVRAVVSIYKWIKSLIPIIG